MRLHNYVIYTNHYILYVCGDIRVLWLLRTTIADAIVRTDRCLCVPASGLENNRKTQTPQSSSSSSGGGGGGIATVRHTQPCGAYAI
jgi:hypothetical protein